MPSARPSLSRLSSMAMKTRPMPRAAIAWPMRAMLPGPMKVLGGTENSRTERALIRSMAW